MEQLLLPGVAQLQSLQEHLVPALLFIPRDLGPHHFQELQVEELNEAHQEVLEVHRSEAPYHHHCHLEALLWASLCILEGSLAHHLKKLLGVLPDVL